MKRHNGTVGILDIEVYFPKLYVDQSELEIFDGASTGKYTVGLGQTQMACCSVYEDHISMAITVVYRLMKRTGLSYSAIGRLDVGTESLHDVSKSCKSVLMGLFAVNGNHDLEGSDNVNACYGGTAALFNCINWAESSSCHGRLALAVASDVALYSGDQPSARSTGGAGAVCMLVGLSSALTFDSGLRAGYMDDTYDFYKPVAEKFPLFDGPHSVKCYLRGFMNCSINYLLKAGELLGKSVSLVDGDVFLAFHCPYSKLVQKAAAYLACLYQNDLPDSKVVGACRLPLRIEEVEEVWDSKDCLENSKIIEKNGFGLVKNVFDSCIEPSLTFCKRLGNTYCASLYMGLAGLLAAVPVGALLGRRIVLYSFGSGFLSSMFSVLVSAKDEKEEVARMQQRLRLKLEELDSRVKVSPQEYVSMMKEREKLTEGEFTPSLPPDSKYVTSDTYYIASIDTKHRRTYKLKEN